MSLDSAVPIAWDVLKSVLAPIKRQFGYVISSKSYAQDLQKEVGELAKEAERVHVLVEVAKNNVRRVYTDVSEWQASAVKALKEAQDLLGDFEEASKTCCRGTLPDPICRYRFSKSAKDNIKVVQALAQTGREFKELNNICSSAPAPGYVAALTPASREGKGGLMASASSASTLIKLREDGVFESRASIIQGVMDALADNSNSVVGVYGMGGVGKSTLLVDAERRIREDKWFDWVAKAVVSENPDIRRIQGEIADALGLTDIKDKETVSGRAELLHRRLEDEEREKRKVLIILDNLWKGLDLKSVGIPCGHDNKVMGCKLLLTSRDGDVLQREMGCDRDFHLDGLQEEEARRLFERIVGDKVQDDEFKPLVDEALHKCAGLPFLIISVAKLFKHACLSELKDALKQIEMSTNKGISGVINKMLQLSYDHFKGEEGEEVKSVLRLCVVYGFSELSLEDLVRYGVGLRLFREDSTMEEARDRLSSLIRTLQASSLLLDDKDGNGFKIHDLVRGFVASVTSRDYPLIVLKDKDKSVTELPKDKLKSCRAICFPYIDMKEFPEELDCPELQIFLLFTNNNSFEVPYSFFSSMTKLMVLNLQGIRLTRSPLPFQLLENLHTLCLKGCSLEDVAIVGELKGLQILSFVNSKIQRLPKEIGQLVELRLLDLNYCSRLWKIEPGVLGRLTKLEELYMENSFDKWNAGGQTPPTSASLIELNNMKNLCTLHVSIPDPNVLPEDLNVSRLTKYKIRIGNVQSWSSSEGSRRLELKLDPISNILRKGCIRTILSRSDDLVLDGWNEIEQSICVLSPEGFPKLKYLKVENNPSVHYILRWPSVTDFKMLESLDLVNLINLEKICNSHISTKPFSALKVVKVQFCNKMEVLFPHSLLRELPHLEEIQVGWCNLMREIVEADGCGKVELHNLHVLELRDLPIIKNFFTVGTAPSSSILDDQVRTQVAFFKGPEVSIPFLESLTMGQLPNLKHIWSKNPCGMRFHNLKQLKVFGCDNLGFMFFSSMVKSLSQLRELRVSNCEKMETIIMEEEGLEMETSETLAFPMLTNLHFEDLESLTCFSSGKSSREAWNRDGIKTCSTILFNGEVAFPSLETLDIIGMDNIEIIWDSQVAADSFHNLKSLGVHECNKLKCVWNKELVHQVKFQGLCSVTVSRCQSLTSLFPASVARDVMQLEELKVHDCGIVELIEKDGQVPRDVFPKLTSLELKHLIEMKCIYTGTHALHWPALKTLKVYGCNKVEVLASHHENEMPLHKQPLFLIEKGVLPNLQELKLDLSRRMEICHGHFQDDEFLCKLRVLELHHISKEFAISTCCFVQRLNNLEELVVIESYLEELSIKVEAVEGPSQELKVILPLLGYFQQLKTLDVSHCEGLSSIFTPAIVENLVRLTKLRISHCKMLLEVISDEGGKEGHVVVFNQLKYVELDWLTGLRCFSSGGYTLMFPVLEDVIVTGCLNMKFFSEGPIVAPKLERVQVRSKVWYVTIEEWFWKENLNVTIQNMFEEMATVVGVEFMWLSEFPELIGQWHSKLTPINSSWQLRSLVVDKCPSLINAIPSRLIVVLERLFSLQVCNCESIEEIFNLEGLEAVEGTWVLPQLISLNMFNLPKLRQLWNKDLQGTLCLNSLKFLTLYNCSNLRHAFAPLMARSLANLEWVLIEECGQMEGVIAEEEGQGSNVEKITFPKIERMSLKCLPNLTSFLSGKNHTLNCPRLEQLTIAHCPKMRSMTWQSSIEIDHGAPSLFTPQVQFPRLKLMVLSHMDNLSKIWTFGSQETLTFKHLRKVEAQNCKNLENLFPRWVATSLTQLEEIQVESCGLKEIVASGDDISHPSTAQFLFPELNSLVLHYMPQLKSFCPDLPTLNWPFLKELRVTHCDKLNMCFAASMNKWAKRDDQHGLSDHEAHFLFERAIPNLERLLLVDKDIQMIQNGKFSDDVFGKPRALTLACFHDENAVFPPIFLLQRFQNLQSLEVFCSSFEEIFLDEGLVDEGKQSVLQNLRELRLSKLHNLKHVWREDCVMAKILQSINKFVVWDCPGLTTLFPAVTSFQNLTELVVKNSSGLVHLVTISAITNLVHLTSMTIIGCERMTEVVANDENEEGKVISLGKLEWLTLEHLPNLVCFSSTISCIFRFPSLFRINVEECPKMKIFSKGKLSTPELYYARLFKYSWDVKRNGDLNTAIRKLST